MRIPHTLRAGLLSIAAATLFSHPVTALSQDAPCHENGAVLRAEVQKEGQRFVAWALSSRGNLVWLFENPEDHTWTLIEGFRDGAGCRINSGTDWEWLPDDGGQR